MNDQMRCSACNSDQIVYISNEQFVDFENIIHTRYVCICMDCQHSFILVE